MPVTYTANDARTRFAEIVSKATFGQEPAIITRSGKPVVAVIAYDQFLQYQEWVRQALQSTSQDVIIESLQAQEQDEVNPEL